MYKETGEREEEKRMANRSARIAQVIGKANLSGVDTVVMEYYRHMDRSRIQFDFILDGTGETLIDEEIRRLGGRIYKVEPYERNMARSVQQWAALFRENRYPIVHAHLNTLSVFPLYAAWRAGVPVRIAHNHSIAAPGEGKRTLMKYLLRPWAGAFATHYGACSELAGKWLFGKCFYDAGKVRLIKNAVNIGRFSYNAETRGRIRKELNLDGKPVIGHVGRFVYQKNHDLLLDIFREIHARNPRAALLLVGSGDLEDAMMQKADALGLAGSVLFLGTRADVPDLMQAMDVFLFPSNYEGLGMAVIEAQTSGLRTVVSEAVPEEAKVTDLLEYCSLMQPASAWADKVLDILAHEICVRRTRDEDLRRAGYEIGQAAKELGEWYEKLLSYGEKK